MFQPIDQPRSKLPRDAPSANRLKKHRHPELVEGSDTLCIVNKSDNWNTVPVRNHQTSKERKMCLILRQAQDDDHFYLTFLKK